MVYTFLLGSCHQSLNVLRLPQLEEITFPWGNTMRYFKGLFLASEPRAEFSSSQMPGFIPVCLCLVFEDNLVVLEVLVSHLPHTFQKAG